MKAQALTAAPATAVAGPSPSEVGKDRYTDLIKTTLRGFEERNADAILSKYADKVVYRGYGVVDQKFIRADLEKYFARWPTTQVQLTGAVQVINTDKPDEKRVLFSYDFRAASPNRNVVSVGSAGNEWWVWETQGNLKVFGDKQKVNR